MNLTPEKLREIVLRVRDEMSVKGFRWIPDNEAVLTGERLFTEFQKLQDSRIAELVQQRDEYRSASLDDTLRLRAKHDQLAAKLKEEIAISNTRGEKIESLLADLSAVSSDSIQIADRLKALEEQEPIASVVSAFVNGGKRIVWLSDYPEAGTMLYAAPVAPSVPEGYVLVLKSVLDQFPEINPSNYGHDADFRAGQLERLVMP